MKPEFEKKLREIFIVVLNLKENESPEEARQLTDERWDSLAQVSMIAAIENEFSISINPKSYPLFTSYKSVRNILDEILKEGE